MRRILIPAFITLLAACTIQSDISFHKPKKEETLQSQTLNQYKPLSELINKAKTAVGLSSGTAVIFIKEGQIVYENYFGYANIEKQQKVDENTVFYIASTTKPLFSLATLLLEHQGKLNTSENLANLFPDLVFNGFDADKITVKHLLTHTMGIDNTPLVLATAYSGIHDQTTRKALVASSYLNEQHGLGDFDYSNVGYNIYSVWIDETFSSGWRGALQQQIFTPLGLTHTSTRMSDAQTNHWSVAKPYSLLNIEPGQSSYLEKQDNTMHAAGGIISSAKDMASLLLAEINGGRLNNKQIFPADLIQQSQVQQVVTDSKYQDFERKGYAWGWYRGSYKGKEMLHHFGGFNGTHAHLSFIPDEKMALVVLNNEDFFSSRLTTLIADYLYGKALNESDIEAKVNTKLDALIGEANKLPTRIAQSRSKLNSRTWNLSQPIQNYAGIYNHPLLGNIHIAVDDQQHMQITWGNLKATATAYTTEDSIRVELVPNSGQVIQFNIQSDQIVSLISDSVIFTKSLP